jgi:hypothetical protein
MEALRYLAEGGSFGDPGGLNQDVQATPINIFTTSGRTEDPRISHAETSQDLTNPVAFLTMETDGHR